jgi:GntR family transcriptional repressor for pyruvate dehydrogenase complex
MPRTKQDFPDTQRTLHVVNHIRSLIENGTLQLGNKIPPEREFAHSLKISRASLRTGIGYLAATGVMKVRRGVGSFVADGSTGMRESEDMHHMYRAIRSRNPEEARKLMEQHLRMARTAQGMERSTAKIYNRSRNQPESFNARQLPSILAVEIARFMLYQPRPAPPPLMK